MVVCMNIVDFFLDPVITNAIIAFLVLALGFLSGKTAMNFFLRFADKTGLRKSVKFGLEREAKKFGFEIDIIMLFAVAVKYSIYLIAILIAMDILQLKAASIFIALVLPYLPQLLGAILIVIIGSAIIEIVADVIKFSLRDHLDDAAREAGLSQSLSTMVASFIRYFLYLLVFLTALLQLGFRAEGLLELLIAIVIIFAAAVAIIVILFVKNHVQNLSSWIYLKNSLEIKPGDTVTIGNVSGKVEKIAAINTVIAQGNDKYFVPNSKFTGETFTVKKK